MLNQGQRATWENWIQEELKRKPEPCPLAQISKWDVRAAAMEVDPESALLSQVASISSCFEARVKLHSSIDPSKPEGGGGTLWTSNCQKVIGKPASIHGAHVVEPGSDDLFLLV